MKALTKTQAERLVRKINASIEATVALIIEAFEGQCHLALGYQTWQDFATAELTHVKYSPKDRMKASVDLTEAGLSTRSAAAALGVNKETVSRDLKAADGANAPVAGELSSPETAPEETAPDAGPAAPKKPRKRRKNPTVMADRGAQIEAQVDEYRAVMTKHPTWTVKSVQEHLGISHQDVGRRRLWSQAPGEAQTYLYSGQITPAVAETVLSNQHVKDEDKMVVLRKFVDGVITTTGAPKVRAIMARIPEVRRYPDLRLRWSSPDLQMTFEQLSEELIDLRNSRVVSKREQAEKAAEIKMLAGSGFNAMEWLDEIAGNLDLVEEMWPVLSAIPLVRTKLQKRLAENGNRMLRLAERNDQPAADEGDETQPTGPPSLVVVGEVVS